MKFPKALLFVFCLVFLLLPLASQPADYFFYSSAAQSRLWGTSPGTRNSGLSAFANPAYPGMQGEGYWELDFVYASDGLDFLSPLQTGSFWAGQAFSLGFLYSFLPEEEQEQIDLHIGLGLGNRFFSLGFANGGVYTSGAGPDRFFHNYRAGLLCRPAAFLSLGLTVSGTYNDDWMEVAAEMGLRPLGNSVLTLLAGYSLLFDKEKEREHYWTAGLSVRPIPGVLIHGTYHGEKKLSLGLEIKVNGLALGATLHTERDFSSIDSLAYTLSYSKNSLSRDLRLGGTPGQYLELNLKEISGYRPGRAAGAACLLDLLFVIEKARDDGSIAGIILNTSGFSADREFLWELRSALEDFQSAGKKVAAFLDSGDFDLYYLVSAADTIVMDPAGVLSFLGYSYGRGFFKNTLDKLGVGVTELRETDYIYKTAAESFTRADHSPADREQYEAYLEDIFSFTRKTLMAARSWTEEEFFALLDRDFLFSPESAKERGMIDEIGREEAVAQAVKKLEGRTVGGYRVYGNSRSSLMGASYTVSDYSSGKPPVDRWGEPAHIAVIYASGQTELDRGLAARRLSRIIRTAADDPFVKAIVLRINSPGGSAVAADYAAEAVKAARRKKPLVVSMGAVAASGGYWASLYADHIVASPYTLTGSIGVIGTWFYDNGLDEKLGLTIDLVKRGEHADLFAGMIFPKRDLTEEEKERYLTYISGLYGQFVAKVAAGRGMPVQRVEELARGRVYSGLAARENGLVDSIGGLGRAIDIAKELAGLDPGREIRFEEYPRPFFLTELLARGFVGLDYGDYKSKLGLGFLDGENQPWLDELRFRFSRNGEVMPILPLGEMIF